MTKLVRLRAKAYSDLLDDGNKDKKAKDTKKCVIKRKLKFENYKNYLEVTQLDNKIKIKKLRKIKQSNIDNIKKKS